ncbi:hypothetical protein [Collimonas sp.]|jgi:hypothetical protein|uniref:hypothetical protein n=1 Tax=Collimonas sp. TaxID=1963772 RepID=UPI002BA954BD|nr:hypothetical protein [Collimonas sp.]HWX02245.1 hypothetical protein [Collimonas sp.]
METLPKVRRIPKGTTSRPSGVRLMPDELAEVDQYAFDEQRSRAWFLRALILRGLAEYKRALPAHQ